MRKTTSKKFIFALLGLLILSVPFSHALSAETKESGAYGIKFQNSWEFMSEKSDEYSRFTEDFGKSSKQRKKNVVACGSVMCHLEEKVCMRKEGISVGSVLRDYFSAGFASVTNGWIGDWQYTVVYDYACVNKNKVSEYQTKGWVDVGKNEENLSSKTTDIFGGDVTKRKEEERGCYTANNTKGELQKYCIREIGDKIEVIAADSDGDGCEVVPVRWYNNRKCNFCFMLGGVYKAADLITQTAHAKLSASFAVIIALGLLIWIAMKTVVFVSAMTKQDAAKYITELLKQSYKFMIAFFALIYYNDVFELIIRPLLGAGLTFGESFVSVQSIIQRFKQDGIEIETIKDILSLSDSDIPADYKQNGENIYYDFVTYVKLENFAYNVNLQYALLQTIGAGLSCLGWNYVTAQLGSSYEFGLGLASMVYGFAFSVFGFFLCMAFVFYLFDALVQLGIVGGLLPFLIASWPFKITSKYTSTGFKMLLNSIFTFMMMGVVVRISMELINTAVQLNSTASEESELATLAATDGTSGAENSELAALVMAIDTIDTEKLKLMVNVLSVGFLLFMFANVMGFLLLGRVNELVNRFASGGMKGAAPSIATMGASAVKGAASKLTAPIREGVGEWVGDKTRKVTRWGVNTGISIATLRPVRKWAHKKINEQLNKGKPDPSTEKKNNTEEAQRQIGSSKKRATLSDTSGMK